VLRQVLDEVVVRADKRAAQRDQALARLIIAELADALNRK
jgi:hypothetical protein